VNGVDVFKLLNWSSLIADLPAGAVLLDAAPDDNEWQGDSAEETDDNDDYYDDDVLLGSGVLSTKLLIEQPGVGVGELGALKLA